ncbi:hypothetical protein MMC13_001518 [Lambiella insularis]|nr:hypothetical protein [Lambiella insularis]
MDHDALERLQAIMFLDGSFVPFAAVAKRWLSGLRGFRLATGMGQPVGGTGVVHCGIGRGKRGIAKREAGVSMSGASGDKLAAFGENWSAGRQPPVPPTLPPCEPWAVHQTDATR